MSTMRSNTRLISAALLLVALLLSGVSRAAATESRPLPACVSIAVQAWLLERVGGPLIDVMVLLPPGASPATWEPTPRRLAELSGTRVFFTVGVPLEVPLMPVLRDAFPDLEVISTSDGLQTRKQVSREKHGDHHGHDHGEFDPHIWLDPQLAGELAARMTKALCRLDPDNAAGFEARRNDLAAELDSLDIELRTILEPVRGRSMIVFHPAWGYFAARYGLKQIAIESGGGLPTARGLSRIVDEAGDENPGAIFCQPGFDVTQAQALSKELGVPLVTLDPLARDYADNLRRTAITIRDALLGKK